VLSQLINQGLAIISLLVKDCFIGKCWCIKQYRAAVILLGKAIGHSLFIVLLAITSKISGVTQS